MHNTDIGDVKKSVQTLMQEVLNGTPEGESGTWFVQGDEALLSTLEDLTADEASRIVGEASTQSPHMCNT